MPVELERVAVEPLPGPGTSRPDAGEPLLQPGPASLQDSQPDVCPSLAEECEVDAETVVLPGRRARLGQQVLQPFLAVRGQPVDDLRPAAGPRSGLPGPLPGLPRARPG